MKDIKKNEGLGSVIKNLLLQQQRFQAQIPKLGDDTKTLTENAPKPEEKKKTWLEVVASHATQYKG